MSLNQLLVEMDGFDKSPVIVIAATNTPDALDKALTRPGRFDRQVVVPLPDVEGRLQLLQHYAKAVPLAKKVNLSLIARGTLGCTGADLANLVNQAALHAAALNKACVSQDEFDYARDKVLMGAARSMQRTKEALKLTAYHEGGHSLMALLTPDSIPLSKCTIMARGSSLGLTHMLPLDDRPSVNYKQLIAQIDVAMGGRAAEEIIFGESHVTTGASSDLQTANNIARKMVTMYGFGDSLEAITPRTVQSHNIQMSSNKRKANDEKIRKMLDESYQRAMSTLTQHKEELHRLAQALLEYGTLNVDEIKIVIKGGKIDRPVLEQQAVISAQPESNDHEQMKV